MRTANGESRTAVDDEMKKMIKRIVIETETEERGMGTWTVTGTVGTSRRAPTGLREEGAETTRISARIEDGAQNRTHPAS